MSSNYIHNTWITNGQQLRANHQ